MDKKETHLDVYKDRSVLHDEGKETIYCEGHQSSEAQSRYNLIIRTLESGYLRNLYKDCLTYDYSHLDTKVKQLIEDLTNGVTSEVGRALTGLTFLQLTIKSITPEQSVRLHKGSARNTGFSWVEGISMRTIDSRYNTPFLREYNLLNINKDGIMMTRSLAENYPYSKVYKADMRGPVKLWIDIIDLIESGKIDNRTALAYMLTLLINKSQKIEELATNAVLKVNSIRNRKFDEVRNLLTEFFTNTRYSARAFEVVIHSFMQAYIENDFSNLLLVPISQMRSANKKHGNVGDIELKDGIQIVESWDAKYGKHYLYEELSELHEKLELNDSVKVAGFIVNTDPDKSKDIMEKAEGISSITGTCIELFSFTEWVNYKMKEVDPSKWDKFANDWLVAVVESFARKRIDIAPIDEPCEDWLTDLINLI